MTLVFIDFRVETNANTHAIFLDDSADALGIFTANPTSELTVEGDVSASGNFITTATGSVGRLNFDGVGGHTFIQETADDTLKIIVGGEAKMEFAEDSENIFMQANNYNFRDASFNNSFKIEANNHLLSGSITSTGSFGDVIATSARFGNAFQFTPSGILNIEMVIMKVE